MSLKSLKRCLKSLKSLKSCDTMRTVAVERNNFKPFKPASLPNISGVRQGFWVKWLFLLSVRNRLLVGVNTAGVGDSQYCGEVLRHWQGWRR